MTSLYKGLTMADLEQKNRFWGSISELRNTSEFTANQGKEFPSPPEEQPITAMDRRDFLKIMGASFLMASTAACRKPVEKIIPYVNKPEEVTPGVANWYASTCMECSAGCGIIAKTREGRPIKLEGNLAHPLTQGGLCARGQSSLLNLYDPARLREPTTIGNGGKQADTTWAESDKEIIKGLAKAKANGKKTYLLTGVINSPSTNALIQDFLKVYPGTHVPFEAVVPEEISAGAQLSYGIESVPHYRLDQASYIVSFGADFLGTWLSPVEFAKKFSQGRRADNKVMSRFVAIEPALTMTGANADEYFPVKPGDELTLALALAHEIIVKHQTSNLAGNSAITSALSAYTPEFAEKQTGVSAATIKKIATELIAHKGKSLVFGGAVKGKNNVLVQVVANLLNTALENNQNTIDWANPSYQAGSSLAGVLAFVEDVKAGLVGAVIIDRSNPVFTWPKSLGLAALLQRIPLVVSLADRVDETAAIAHFVCPDHHYLESWNDVRAVSGTYSIVQPMVRPLFNTRSFQDSLLNWSGQTDSWYNYLRNNWKNSIFETTLLGDFEGSWIEVLQKGFYAKNESKTVALSFNTQALLNLPKPVASELALSVYPALSYYDGRSANNPWIQELPDPISKATWDNYLSLAPKKAEELGLVDGDVVEVDTGKAHQDLPVLIQPKLNVNSAMVAFGGGRTHAGEIGNGVGRDVSGFQVINGTSLEWGGQSIISIKKTGKSYPLAVTQGHHTLDGRHTVEEATYPAFLKNPLAGKEGEGEPVTLWKEHEYKGYRWGMAIDTNSCIGCNGCMVSCMAENNIPVVGKAQVINGREMHWIRLDRYYTGDVENPDIVYQPMLCQQCENAPCETVCPVLATIHNDEGLNIQVYNRCVGTRYCANNCPYKVRRFNYFEYWRNVSHPMELMLNPEISVRTRGIMEKCTFCVHRIQEARIKAKINKTKIADGDVVSACQQSCPTNAITFGDLNDPHSAISKLKKSPRGYHVLEDLNVRPQVTYLRKLRNTEESAHS